MSKFRDFENAMLVGLYKAWKDGRDLIPLGNIAGTQNLSYEKGWLVRFHDSATEKGFLRGPTHRRIEEMAIGALTADGLAFVEDNLIVDEDDLVIAPEVVAKEKADDAISSSSWTGRTPTIIISEEKLEQIVVELGRAEHALVALDAPQLEKSQAHAYIVAARSLLEAPEPQTDLSWEILQRGNNLAGIASLFIALIALFK